MSAHDPSTIEPTPAHAHDANVDERVPAVVIAWLEGDPDLVGAVLFPEVTPAIFGRGSGDGLEPRLRPTRQLPGVNVALAAPAAAWMSRRQLRIAHLPEAPSTTSGPGMRVAIENLGKSPMRARGLTSAQVIVGPGDLVALGDGALLMITTRPRTLPGAPSWLATPHALGDADVFAMVGDSPAMWALREQLAFTARQKGHVLVLGMSGSGKERVAQALHRMSPRGKSALVARNAATIPTALMDVELFGHVASYPNPGMRERPGLIGEADGSTLFLDEIGELPDELQVHLLRVMDSGDYQRLGDSRPRKADVRVVAATNRGPESLKADLRARFRHVVVVPPLSERREDVPLLLRHILRTAARDEPSLVALFSDLRTRQGHPSEPRVDLELIAGLLRHPLPLQVRELEAIAWSAIAKCTAAGSRGRLSLPELSLAEGATSPAPVAPTELTKADLQAAIERHGGHLERVWRELGLKNRYVLRRLLDKHGLRATEDS